MELNIQEIADVKIKAMHESGQIKESIETGIEKIILKSIDDALDGYDLRCTIRKQISDSISDVVNDIGFSAYNGFIAQKVKEITENVMREDVANKIQKVFDDMLIAKHDGIKLSEIINGYREHLFETINDEAKWEHQHFTCDVDQEEDGNFTWYTIKLSDQQLSSHEEPQIKFRILAYGEKESAKICGLYFDGESVNGKFKLGSMDDFECLLANLYFNETPIILDPDDVDDDDYYDIDN